MSQTERIIGLENRFSAHNYAPLDVAIRSAQGSHVKDVEGNTYLDMLAGYGALNQGHLHPRIMEAAQDQMSRLTLTSRAFRNDQMGEFAEALCNLAGKDKMLPMNTGAEAVETAIKIARRWGYEKKGVEKDRAEIITASGNFHGRTTTITGFSTEEAYREGFGAFTPGFRTVSFNDVESLREAITPNTVGFLVEPIQAEGGVIVPDEGYLREAADICRENNVLLITDEIQTGFGRTGEIFASWHDEVDPDILVVGKSLSGGVVPVSAALANDHIMEVIKPGTHGSTYGGNPLASAVAKAAIEVVVDEDLAGQAREKGAYFMDGLRGIQQETPYIKDVRGKGLLIGVEIDGPAREICERLEEKRILAKDAHEQVVRFTPPLVIEREDIDSALTKIQEVFNARSK